VQNRKRVHVRYTTDKLEQMFALFVKGNVHRTQQHLLKVLQTSVLWHLWLGNTKGDMLQRFSFGEWCKLE